MQYRQGRRKTNLTKRGESVGIEPSGNSLHNRASLLRDTAPRREARQRHVTHSVLKGGVMKISPFHKQCSTQRLKNENEHQG